MHLFFTLLVFHSRIRKIFLLLEKLWFQLASFRIDLKKYDKVMRKIMLYYSKLQDVIKILNLKKILMIYFIKRKSEIFDCLK